MKSDKFFPVTITVFAAGCAMFILEVLSFRMIVPFVGGATPIWASVIGMYLIGNSIGYYLGGMYADKTQKFSMFGKFFLVAGIYSLCTLGFRYTPLFLPEALTPISKALIVSGVLLLVPIVLLSAVIVYAARLLLQSLSGVAQVHGHFYKMATLGSVIGIFLASYLLIPNFSISTIITALSIVLILIGIRWLTNE